MSSATCSDVHMLHISAYKHAFCPGGVLILLPEESSLGTTVLEVSCLVRVAGTWHCTEMYRAYFRDSTTDDSLRKAAFPDCPNLS